MAENRLRTLCSKSSCLSLQDVAACLVRCEKLSLRAARTELASLAKCHISRVATQADQLLCCLCLLSAYCSQLLTQGLVRSREEILCLF